MGRYQKYLARFRRDREGATAVEAAFLFPIIVFVLIGFVLLGAYFQGIHSAKRTTESVARQVRLLTMPDEATIKQLLTDQLPAPIVGTYTPTVTIDDTHVGGTIARINVAYSYKLGIPSASQKSGVLGLDLNTTADTQVKLRTMPSAS